MKFAETRFDGVVPAGGEPGPLEQKLYTDVSARLEDITAQFEAIEIRKMAQGLRALWVLGNEYLQEAAPWTAIKTDPDRAAVVVRTALNLVGLFARVSAPVIPFSAEKIAEGVGEPYPPSWPSLDAAAELARIEPGRPIRTPEVLFAKIEDTQVAEWTERFAGAPADA
jgi:methionyl-tRNA synthetase